MTLFCSKCRAAGACDFFQGPEKALRFCQCLTFISFPTNPNTIMHTNECRVQSNNCSLYRDESLHGKILIWMCYLNKLCTGAALLSTSPLSRGPTEPAALARGGSSFVRDCTPLGEGATQSHSWKNKFLRLDLHTTLYPVSAGCVCLMNDITSSTLSLQHPKLLPRPRSSPVEAQAGRTGPSLCYLHEWDVASALMRTLQNFRNKSISRIYLPGF